MEFSTTTARAETIKADVIAVGVFADGALTPSARAIDKAARGAVKSAVKSGDMTGKRGALVMLRAFPGLLPRASVVGLGKPRGFSDKRL